MNFNDNSCESQTYGSDSNPLKWFKQLLEGDNLISRIKRNKLKANNMKKSEQHQEIRNHLIQTFEGLVSAEYATVIQHKVSQISLERPKKLTLLDLTSSLFNTLEPYFDPSPEPFINYDSLRSLETLNSIGSLSTKTVSIYTKLSNQPSKIRETKATNHFNIKQVEIKPLNLRNRLPRILNFIRPKLGKIL